MSWHGEGPLFLVFLFEFVFVAFICLFVSKLYLTLKK